MTNEQFQNELEKAFLRSKALLNKKEKEYSDGKDRLCQFKQVGALNDVAPTDALWGMVSKHISSLATMVKDPSSYNLKQWREKLTDARNYTFLLDALLVDLGIT